MMQRNARRVIPSLPSSLVGRNSGGENFGVFFGELGASDRTENLECGGRTAAPIRAQLSLKSFREEAFVARSKKLILGQI